jgi:hypothetical protein
LSCQEKEELNAKKRALMYVVAPFFSLACPQAGDSAGGIVPSSSPQAMSANTIVT